MNSTRHAEQRRQQRGISPLMLDLLLELGEREPAGDGCSKVFFGKRSKRRLRSYAGPLASHFQEHMDVYLIISSEERIITTGHRTERIRRS